MKSRKFEEGDVSRAFPHRKSPPKLPAQTFMDELSKFSANYNMSIMLVLLLDITALGNTTHICDIITLPAPLPQLSAFTSAQKIVPGQFLGMAFRVHICQPSMFSCRCIHPWISVRLTFISFTRVRIDAVFYRQAWFPLIVLMKRHIGELMLLELDSVPYEQALQVPSEQTSD